MVNQAICHIEFFNTLATQNRPPERVGRSILLTYWLDAAGLAAHAEANGNAAVRPPLDVGAEEAKFLAV